MNVRLLRRIKREILNEPRRFDMDDWIETESTSAPCGTTACIGGWACILNAAGKAKITKESLPPIAREQAFGYVDENARLLLEITINQSNRLFYKENWPEKFKGGRSKLERAKLAARRIEHFIKTRGAPAQKRKAIAIIKKDATVAGEYIEGKGQYFGGLCARPSMIIPPSRAFAERISSRKSNHKKKQHA